jgi:hypothetical protein
VGPHLAQLIKTLLNRSWIVNGTAAGITTILLTITDGFCASVVHWLAAAITELSIDNALDGSQAKNARLTDNLADHFLVHPL